MKTYVLYHGNCPDGTGAALAAWLKFGDSAEYIPVSYGKPPPETEKACQMFIVDFSYPRATLENLGCNHCDQLVVLDHHETARQELEGLPGCHFDMTKSGAVLAWQYFFPSEPVPVFIQYLQDRDLWKFELPLSREVSAAVGSYPFTIESFRAMSGIGAMSDKDTHSTQMLYLARLQDEGRGCLRLKNQQVENMAKHYRRATLDGKHRTVKFDPPALEGEANGFGTSEQFPTDLWFCPVANASVFFSEVGEKLLELFPDAPFSAYYSDRSDGKRQWGLRSRPSFDCSVIAKSFGGGGHKQAAGFVQDI